MVGSTYEYKTSGNRQSAPTRAADGQSERSVDAKLKAIREAVQYNYPTADVDEMLKEIGAGYLGAGDTEFPAS